MSTQSPGDTPAVSGQFGPDLVEVFGPSQQDGGPELVSAEEIRRRAQ